MVPLRAITRQPVGSCTGVIPFFGLVRNLQSQQFSPDPSRSGDAQGWRLGGGRAAYSTGWRNWTRVGDGRAGLRAGTLGSDAVGVAQLVELLVVVQAVGGSSPLAHPSEIPASAGVSAFRGLSTGGGSPQIPPPTCRMPGTAAEPGEARSAIGARNLRGRPEPADRGRPAAASSRSSARSGDSPDSHSVPEPANPLVASLRGAISAFWNPCLGNRAVGTVIGTRSAARFNWRPSRPAIVRLVARPCATSTGTPMNHEDSPNDASTLIVVPSPPTGMSPHGAPSPTWNLRPTQARQAWTRVPFVDGPCLARSVAVPAWTVRQIVSFSPGCLVGRLGDLYRRADNQSPGSWRRRDSGEPAHVVWAPRRSGRRGTRRDAALVMPAESWREAGRRHRTDGDVVPLALVERVSGPDIPVFPIHRRRNPLERLFRVALLPSGRAAPVWIRWAGRRPPLSSPSASSIPVARGMGRGKQSDQRRPLVPLLRAAARAVVADPGMDT